MLTIRARMDKRPTPRNLVSGEKDKDPFHERFIYAPGYNLRPGNERRCWQGAIRELPGFLKHRRENAEYLRLAFSDVKGVALQKKLASSGLVLSDC